MTIQRGGKKPAKKPEKKCPPHNMKRVHRSINFIKGKKWVSLFFECQNPGCDHKDSTVKEG